MGIPKSWVMVLTSPLEPWSKAALILLEPLVPAMWTKVSRGIDSMAAFPVLGTRWTRTIVSLRLPPTWEAEPNFLAWAELLPARVSEPIRRIVFGAPAPGSAALPLTATRLIWPTR
jgi:hypothetical protein